MLKDFKEILTGELLSVTAGLAAGAMLTFVVNKIYLIPALLILLPGFLEMRGNISGSISARLGAGLHIGALKSGEERGKIVKGNILASFILVVLVSLFLGFAAYYLSAQFFYVTNINIIIIALFAGIVSSFIQIPLTIVTTFWLFGRGHDPDNIMGPYITATGDVISIISLIAALAVFA